MTNMVAYGRCLAFVSRILVQVLLITVSLELKSGSTSVVFGSYCLTNRGLEAPYIPPKLSDTQGT